MMRTLLLAPALILLAAPLAAQHVDPIATVEAEAEAKEEPAKEKAAEKKIEKETKEPEKPAQKPELEKTR